MSVSLDIKARTPRSFRVHQLVAARAGRLIGLCRWGSNKTGRVIIYFHWFNRHVGLHIHILSHHKTILYAIIYSARCVLIVISEQTTNTAPRRGSLGLRGPAPRPASPVLATVTTQTNRKHARPSRYSSAACASEPQRFGSGRLEDSLTDHNVTSDVRNEYQHRLPLVLIRWRLHKYSIVLNIKRAHPKRGCTSKGVLWTYHL